MEKQSGRGNEDVGYGERVEIRASPAEVARWRSAADREKLSLSEWLRRRARFQPRRQDFDRLIAALSAVENQLRLNTEAVSQLAKPGPWYGEDPQNDSDQVD